MAHLCWSILALVLGGCVGSFLNVVIYRWPRNLSIRRPSRSFCPHCEQPIAWYDNVPVVSYLLLSGRCRRCGAAISLQYPLVELATGLVFLLTYDVFFVARQRIGIGGDLAADWPMLLSHWGLWAGLIVLAVMDLEAYLVDIRVTWIVSAAGVIGHMLWRPENREGWIRPTAEQAAWAVAVVVGLGIAGLLFLRGGAEPGSDEEAPVEEPGEHELSTDAATVKTSWRWIWLIVPIALVVAYVVVVIVAGEQAPLKRSLPQVAGRLLPAYQHPPIEHPPPGLDWGAIRLGIGIAVVFAALALAASRPQPEADSDIIEAIRAEASDARRNALGELKFLTPAIVLGAAALFWLSSGATPDPDRVVDRVLHWRPLSNWQPLWGVSTAVTGWVIGGAIGWLARIGFTLLFGKEALGMGDVHILASAGAVAGWPVALAGFFLAAPLALLAIVVIHLRRQSRALPYGPWLALAFLLAGMFQDRILLYLDLRLLFERA